jgi:hypothetical protein
MPNLNIRDDLMAPSDTVKINYRGPNPAGILGLMPDLIRNTMKISSKDLFETDLRWDNSSENNTFYAMWMGKRTEDNWSKTFIRAVAQGTQNAKDKTGDFNLQLKGWLATKYDYSNFFQRGFWFIYNYKFYHEQRRKYIDNGKDDILEMKSIVLSKFRIGQEE